jgi:alpha-methylacyl-CoA racemase
MSGPLSGVRIIEIAGIGPGPFAAMMLGDHGAEVIQVVRPGARVSSKDPVSRSRRSVIADLKTLAGVQLVRDLCRTADGLIEGFRPGVMERLGLGPELLLGDNPKLVYGRMTGWGQDGPYAQAAGHDINYIALAGALHAFGRAGEKPTPPINMVGDYAGGAMMLAFGMVCALMSAQKSGKGQVVDCAMVDGSALLMAVFYNMLAQGVWHDERGANIIDTGSHFYDTYETRDGKFISLGALEPQFYAEFRQRVGLADDPAFDTQMDPALWPAQKARLTELFKSMTRDQWCAILEHTDVCFAPVLSMREAPAHPHNVHREIFIKVGGAVQPAPAPRYSATPTGAPTPAVRAGTDTAALLAELGYDPAKIAAVRGAAESSQPAKTDVKWPSRA